MSLAKYLDQETIAKYPEEEYLQDYDIIVNSTGNGTLGRIGVFHDSDRIDASVIVPDSHVTIVRLLPIVDREYILSVIRYYQPYLEKFGQGSTNQTELKPAVIANLLIPVPPYYEQVRIAKKLTDVAPLIQAYGISNDRLQNYNSSFPDALKKSILQEAVQGKLVPQNPDDESASVLLERIQAEKQQLIKAGKIKKSKSESTIYRRDNSYYEKSGGIERCIDDEIPFEIPESWEWARCSSLGAIVRGSGIKRTETVDKGYPCIRYGELYTTYNISFTKTVSFVPEELFNQCKHIENGDVLFTLTGENKPDIAKTIAYLGDKPIAVGGDLAFWTHHRMNPLYLTYYMLSPYAINVKVKLATGDIIVHISGDKVGSMLIPIPPLAEQHRIVEKIKELTKIIEHITY